MGCIKYKCSNRMKGSRVIRWLPRVDCSRVLGVVACYMSLILTRTGYACQIAWLTRLQESEKEKQGISRSILLPWLRVTFTQNVIQPWQTKLHFLLWERRKRDELERKLISGSNDEVKWGFKVCLWSGFHQILTTRAPYSFQPSAKWKEPDPDTGV